MADTPPSPQDRDWARPVVHWHITAVDVEAQTAFYRELFSWKIGDGPFPMADPGIGGPEPGPAGHFEPGDAPGISLYVQVRDLAETLARVPSLGGKVIAPPFQFPEQPTMARIEDPEGNALTLVQQ